MQTPQSTEARILVVDDERVNVVLLERILQQAGYTNLKSTTDSTQGRPHPGGEDAFRPGRP